ncbi:MAG: ribbon-helix-helix protein, CopG family, partial [Myxococcales bacterium]|nr:ribbon-helix-helix protein, CopG family [Myxococcales bacterium]
MAGNTVKISANLSEEVVQALRELAEEKGVTMTEMLRQAISLEKFLSDQVKEGKKVLLEDKDK